MVRPSEQEGNSIQNSYHDVVCSASKRNLKPEAKILDNSIAILFEFRIKIKIKSAKEKAVE